MSSPKKGGLLEREGLLERGEGFNRGFKVLGFALQLLVR